MLNQCPLLVVGIKPIEEQYATSFEEAFILTNYRNKILNEVLNTCKPEIYKDIVGQGKDKDFKKLISNSFKLQRKLAASKSDFANALLYKIILSNSNTPSLPSYLGDGLEWLANKLLTPSPSGDNNASK